MQLHWHLLIRPTVPLLKLLKVLPIEQSDDRDEIQIERRDNPLQKVPITYGFTLEQHDAMSDTRGLPHGHCSASSSEIPEGPTTVKSSLMDQLSEVVR